MPPLTLKKTILLLLFACLLQGCSLFEAGDNLFSGISDSLFGSDNPEDAPTPLSEYVPELEIDTVWREKTGIGADEQFLKLIAAVSYGKIFSADRDGLITARNAATGELVWETETGYSFSAGPGIGVNTVIMGSSDAEVVAFNIETGEQKWSSFVSSEVLSTPVIAKNIVIVCSIDGQVTALSESDGSQLWIFERSVPALSIRGSSTPLIVGESVIVAYANGKMTSLRLSDGKNQWETSIAIPGGSSEVERLVDLDADPIVSDGVIFVASYQGGTSAVLEIDGDVLWRNESVSAYSGIGFDWQYIYLSDNDSEVWQLDQRNGASLWKQDALYHRRLSPPTAYDNFVVVGDLDGFVHWLATKDGRQLARIKVADAPIEMAPVVIDNIVYVYAKDGTLGAYKARVF